MHKWNKDNIIQFIKFGIVGASNTVVSYVVYVLTLYSLHSLKVSWDYFVGNLLGFVLSVLWSFYWNNRYVFQKKHGENRNPWKALFKMYLSYGFTGIILSNALSYLWIDVIGIPKLIAPLINCMIGIPVNFVLNKYWTFEERPKRDHLEENESSSFSRRCRDTYIRRK